MRGRELRRAREKPIRLSGPAVGPRGLVPLQQLLNSRFGVRRIGTAHGIILWLACNKRHCRGVMVSFRLMPN
jgi:hypothetical protein